MAFCVRHTNSRLPNFDFAKMICRMLTALSKHFEFTLAPGKPETIRAYNRIMTPIEVCCDFWAPSLLSILGTKGEPDHSQLPLTVRSLT